MSVLWLPSDPDIFPTTGDLLWSYSFETKTPNDLKIPFHTSRQSSTLIVRAKRSATATDTQGESSQIQLTSLKASSVLSEAAYVHCAGLFTQSRLLSGPRRNSSPEDGPIAGTIRRHHETV